MVRSVHILLGVGAVLIALCSGCRTASQPVPPEAIVLSGRVNPLLGPGGKVQCWVLESGEDLRTLKYYALVGPESLMQQLRQEDAVVTLRAVVRTDVPVDCPIAIVAEVYEILSIRTAKD